MTTCEKIDSILSEKGMSRRQLSIKAGIPPSSLQSALSRNKGLSLDMLFPISEVLKLDVEELVSNSLDSLDEPPEVKKKFAYFDKREFLLNSMLDIVNKIGDKDIASLISFFQALNPAGQRVAVKRVEELTEIPKYQRKEEDT